MYELIILGLLLYQPAHGYLITQIINDMVGPWAKVSNGAIYPMLAKLEERGYLAATLPEDGARDGRALRQMRITESGTRRFRQLMLDTSSNPMDYQRIFHFKVHCMEFLAVAERRQLLDHYEVFCQATILHLQHESAEFPSIPSQPRILFWAAQVMSHLVTQWEAELAWVDSLRPLLLNEEIASEER